MKQIDLIDFNLEEDFEIEHSEHGKEHTLLTIKVISVISFVCIAVFLSGVCLIKIFALSGARLTSNTNYIFALFGGILFAGGLFSLCAKRIILNHTEDKYKKYASLRFDIDFKHYSKFGNRLRKFFAVVCLLAALFFGGLSSIDYGVYDDHFTSVFAVFDIEEFQYDDVEFYQILGYYSDGEYLEYEKINYVLIYGDDGITYLDDFEKDSEQDQYIRRLAFENNKQIIVCKDDAKLINSSEEY